jgi:hypothetical protein
MVLLTQVPLQHLEEKLYWVVQADDVPCGDGGDDDNDDDVMNFVDP